MAALIRERELPTAVAVAFEKARPQTPCPIHKHITQKPCPRCSYAFQMAERQRDRQIRSEGDRGKKGKA